MLECSIDLSRLSIEDLKCGVCNICKPTSKLVYPFERDLLNSDDFVKEMMKYIKEKTGCFCDKTRIDKNPDINVFVDQEKTNLICRVEAKYLEGKSFVKSKQFLGLEAKEALVVDKPKLLSYIECRANDRKNGKDIPIFVAWKYDRPCNDVGGITVFQEIDKLQEKYLKFGSKREFERKTTPSDINDGIKKGITAKYHFSITECKPIEELIIEINKLKDKKGIS